MNSYIIVKFIYDKKGIIDFDFLINSYKKNGRLKDANVLAKLFAIDDNTPFKKENFNKDLFINFDISLQHWNDLIIFLKTGITNFKGNEKIEENTLVDLMYLTTKLGGIPSFDKYYEEFYEQKMINKKNIILKHQKKIINKCIFGKFKKIQTFTIFKICVMIMKLVKYFVLFLLQLQNIYILEN